MNTSCEEISSSRHDRRKHEKRSHDTIRTATGCAKDGFTKDDVSEVLKASPGENDEQSWMMVGTLKDGRFFFLDAWCDYTGWDCQAGGDAQVADTLDNLIRYGMTEQARDRLGYKLDDVA